MAATIWYEKDADLSVFDGKKVAILGYGSQGHAHALNLRDSGVDVVVGLRPTSKSVEYAKEQGLEVKSVADAVAEADVVMILLPDQYQAAVYKKDVEPNLKPGAALAFAHGFNIHYATSSRPRTIRSSWSPRRARATSCVVSTPLAVASRSSWPSSRIRMARPGHCACLRQGSGRAACRRHQDHLHRGDRDRSVRRAGRPHGWHQHLCDMGFDVLTEAGYQPEIAYFEVFHELKMLVDLANEGGLNKARWSCSDTAQYGDYTSTVITEETKKRMQYQLKRIQDGSFAKEFMDDQAAGAPKFKKLQEEYSHPHLETVGPKLRAMFSWNNQVDADADMAESFNGKIARTQVQ